MNPPPDSSPLAPPSPPRRIVFTGGPGAGKTAVLEVVRKNFCSCLAVLPEAASILFSGGFPRPKDKRGARAVQRAIFYVQRELEEITEATSKSALHLCDRGMIDGLAYWPGDPQDLWAATKTNREELLARYDTVIHLRTPGRDQGYDHSNPSRTETPEEAQAIDARIEKAWEGHPRRFFLPSRSNFLDKVSAAIELVQRELPSDCSHPDSGIDFSTGNPEDGC